MQKKILIVTSTFPRWEGDTDPSFVFDLARQLSALGHCVDVIAPHARHARSYQEIDNIRITRFRYFFTGWQSLCYDGGIPANLKSNPFNYLLVPFFLLAQLFCFYRMVANNDYDVINAHWLIPQGFICAIGNTLYRKKNIRLVCTVHGSDITGLQDLFSKQLKIWTLRHCHRLIVVSRSLQSKAQELGYPEDKTSVCPMGVDLKQLFTPKKNIKREPQNLIYVGRLISSKGVHCLIRAMCQVNQHYPRALLTVIGDGSEAAELKLLVSTSRLEKCIKFTGAMQRSLLPEEYSQASIAVIPSIQEEGFGLVMIEAMGCGCAVIASAHDSAMEIIDDGSNGLLFPPGDENALALNIMRLLGEPKLMRDLAERGRESVLIHYDWEILLDTYCSALFNN